MAGGLLMVLSLLFHQLVQFCSFSGHGKQCSVPQSRPGTYPLLSIFSLILCFPVELSAWALLHTQRAIPSHGVYIYTRVFSSLPECWLTIWCWLQRAMPMEKSGVPVWKCKTGFPLLFCGFILPFNHLAAQATVLGEENQCLSFSRATSTNIFFYWANTARSRILVKAVNSVTIMIIFFSL